MVIRQALSEATQQLKEANIPQPRMEATLFMQHVLNTDRLGLLHRENDVLSEGDEADYFSYISRRCKAEPTAYILGEKEFMSLKFHVEPGVLIPRPDTEILCEAVIERARAFEKPKILDLCSGSGCIGISLAHYIPTAQVTLMDLSETAVRVTKENAEHLAPDNTQVLQGDAFMLEGSYDIIASNPPYIETDVISGLQTDVCVYEPHMALDGGADGMDFYMHFAKTLQRNLNAGGMLALEVGHTQARKVQALLQAEGWMKTEILCDLSGIERVVIAYKN